MLTSTIRNFGNFMFLNVLTRWVAGSKAEDAISYCKNLNKSLCIIHYLGEHYSDVAPVFQAVKEYRHLVDLISQSKINAAITIKPSQLGFNVLEKEDSEKFCQQQMLEIVKYASEKNVFAWIDMEDSRFTEFSLRFYRRFVSKYRIGITLQAHLKRTEKDLQDLIRLSEKADVRVRLVKGTYVEDEEIALKDPHEIQLKYLALITIAFEQSPKNFGISVASHHSQAIELALKLQEENKKKFFEIEMLKGVLPEYVGQLRKSGVHVAEYVPYGENAFAYSVRRAKKNPKFAKSILFAPFFDAYAKLYG